MVAYAQRLRLRCWRAALVFARRFRRRAACSWAVLRLPRPSPTGATLRASRKIRNAMPPSSTMQTMPTGMTTPVETLLSEVPEAVVTVFAALSSSPAALPVKFDDDSEGAPKASLEDGVSAPAAAGFCAPALVPVSAFANASCTDLSSSALFKVGLEPVAATAQLAVKPKRLKATSVAISDMCEVIRRIVLK